MRKRLEIFSDDLYVSTEQAEAAGQLYKTTLTLNDLNVKQIVKLCSECSDVNMQWRIVDDTILVDKELYENVLDLMAVVFDGETPDENQILYKSEIKRYLELKERL
jgi:hypothetical protein